MRKYLNLLYKTNPTVMTIVGDEELASVYESLVILFNRYKLYEMDVMRGKKLTLNDLPPTTLTINHTQSKITIDITCLCHFSLDNNPMDN